MPEQPAQPSPVTPLGLTTTGLTSEADCATQAWTCNGGFDNQEDNAQCEATIAKHYSPAGSNARIACPTKPSDSSWTTTTGLTSEADCATQSWRSDAGFDNQEDSKLCQATIAKHYSPAGSNARTACPTKPDDSSWTTTTGLTSEADCDTQAWICNGGFDNQEDSKLCQATIAKHYSPAGSNARTACPTKPDDSSWTTTTGLTSEADCDTQAWTCNAGFDNQEDSKLCQATIARHYSPAGSNGRTACPTKPDDSSWTATTGLTSEADCATQAWTCNGGFDNEEDSKLCQATIARYYSPAGSNGRTACTKSNDSSWTTTTGLTSEADCATQAWTCNGGFDNQANSDRCEATIAQHYSPAGSNARTACPDKPDDSSWTTTTGLTSEADCATQAWICNGGFDNQANSDRCEATIAKHYSPAGSNARTACTKPNDSSWTTTTGLTSEADCDTQAWTCNGGFDNQEDSKLCQATIARHYSPAHSNGRTACPTKPDDSSWTATTGLTSEVDCDTQAWTCNGGFDNQEDSSRCQATIARHYSPAGSNGRTACPTKPDDSSWTATTGLTSEVDCDTQAWTCNGGFDNQENNAQCEATIARYYSPAGSNGRTACPTKPDDSSWTATTGLTSEADCDTQAWTCNGGFDNQEDSSRCQATIARHYSPAGSNGRTACPTKSDDSSWTATTGLTSEADCATQAWTCNGGFDNQEDSSRCQATIARHYSPASSNGRTACPTKPDDSSWTATTGLTSEADCDTQAWICNGGFDNQEDSSRCQATIARHYSPAGSNGRTACPTKPDDSSWTATTGLTSEADCATQSWRCDAGFDNQEDSKLCQATIAGHYSPAGSNARTVCSDKPDDSSWTATTGLTSEADCAVQAWTCNGGGFDNQEDSKLCQATIAGHYSPAGSNARTACPTKPDDSSWTTTTGLTSEADCDTQAWTCNAGFDSQANSDRCETTVARHYSPAGSNARTVCSDKPDDSSWTATTGLTSEVDCAAQAWTCDGGFDNQEDNAQCEATIARHYSPAGSNARIACSDTTKPDDSSWDISTTGLTSFRECWSCDASYYPSRNRNACVKVNIAIAAGYWHTCAILDDDGDASNGGLVKCWGSNGSGQTGGGGTSSSSER